MVVVHCSCRPSRRSPHDRVIGRRLALVAGRRSRVRGWFSLVAGAPRRRRSGGRASARRLHGGLRWTNDLGSHHDQECPGCRDAPRSCWTSGTCTCECAKRACGDHELVTNAIEATAAPLGLSSGWPGRPQSVEVHAERAAAPAPASRARRDVGAAWRSWRSWMLRHGWTPVDCGKV